MKIGEVKIQSILLMYPSVQIKLDDTSDEGIRNAISDLEAECMTEEILSASVNSVNRAFSYLERRGLCNTEVIELFAQPVNRHGRAEVLVENMLLVENVTSYTEQGERDIPFFVENGRLILENALGYKIKYKRKIKRISQISDDNEHLDVDERIAQILPYYIKGELFREQSESEADLAMKYFEREVEVLLENELRYGVAQGGEVKSVFFTKYD